MQRRQTRTRPKQEGRKAAAIEGGSGIAVPEATYKALFEHSPTILYLVRQRADGGYLFEAVNPAAYRLTGIPPEHMVGKGPREIFPPGPAALMESSYARCFQTGEMVEYDVEGDSRIGVVSRHTMLVPLKAQDGAVRLLFGTSIDTTATRRLEQQLRQAQKMEAVGQLTAGIAHAFNNLMTVVIGQLHRLPASLLARNEKERRAVASAICAAERAAQLTARLLAFSRKQMMMPRPTDLNYVVTGVEHLLKNAIGEAIRIETTLDDALWPALVDPNQVELALINLALNARDAMPAGGTITIRTANVVRGPPVRAEEPPAGDYVSIALTDTGTGIAPDVLEKIFEPFFTTKQFGGGSGLGLSHVLGVAQQLGGGVGIQTAMGAGTTISLFFPKES